MPLACVTPATSRGARESAGQNWAPPNSLPESIGEPFFPHDNLFTRHMVSSAHMPIIPRAAKKARKTAVSSRFRERIILSDSVACMADNQVGHFEIGRIN